MKTLIIGIKQLECILFLLHHYTSHTKDHHFSHQHNKVQSHSKSESTQHYRFPRRLKEFFDPSDNIIKKLNSINLIDDFRL